MAAFLGYLFKIADTNRVFPTKYIQLDSWQSTPNQREEIKAYRDEETRNLTRITAPGKKSTFSFKTRDGLHLEDKILIQKFFEYGESLMGEEGKEQRKIKLVYWNEETNSYQVGVFYRPNMQFRIKRVTDDDIIYGEMTFEFVEY